MLDIVKVGFVTQLGCVNSKGLTTCPADILTYAFLGWIVLVENGSWCTQ